jgi:putative pyruvate formate lyase activating enzyme
VHEGEEPEISPTHAVLLSGCNYRCAYCSEWNHIAHPERDPATDSKALARSIDARRESGAASLSWIGGEPLVNLPGILETLVLASVSVPVVWNSNMHSTPLVQDLLEGVVDAYVADWKHGNDACARLVARVPDYLATVGPAIARARREAFTIVRHLVIPGHVECCTLPALEAIARALPGIRVNLMAQYRANDNVSRGPLDRRPTADELIRARDAALGLGLDLTPRGRLVGPPGVTRSPTEPVPFESSIFIDADGAITIENLSSELREVARELGSLAGEEAGPRLA